MQSYNTITGCSLNLCFSLTRYKTRSSDVAVIADHTVYDVRYTGLRLFPLFVIWKNQNLRLTQSDQQRDGAVIIDVLRSAIWQWKCHWHIQIGFGYLKLQSKLIRFEGPRDGKIDFYTSLIRRCNYWPCCPVCIHIPSCPQLNPDHSLNPGPKPKSYPNLKLFNE